jgi:hypothetical protein
MTRILYEIASTAFVVSRVQMSLFFIVEAALLLAIFAQVLGFLGKIKKLA